MPAQLKFLLDNNFPPRFASGLNELALGEGLGSVHALRSMFPANSDDLVWIPQLAGSSQWVVVSQDKFKKQNGLERVALARAGLIVFCLQSSWNKLTYWDKAYNLVRWWPRICEQASGIQGKALYSVPLKFGANGKFIQVPF